MKKGLAIVLAGTVAAAALVGCGNTAQQDEDGKITITVSNYPQENRADDRALWDQQAAEFERLHPNIKVEGDTYSYGFSTFVTKAASGQLPTFYRAAFTETDKIASAGYAKDLTDVMAKLGYDKAMNDRVKNLVSYDGKIYGLPREAYYQALLINVPLFKEAGLVNEDGSVKMPQTYDELREMAVTVREKTGKIGFAFPTISNRGGWRFMNIAWSYGVNFMKQENGKWIATFDSQECIDALQYLKDLKWKYNAMPENALIEIDEPDKLFATNQLAMTINASDQDMREIIDKYGISKDDIAFANLPAGPAGRVVQMGGAIEFVKPDATPEQVDACMEYAKFMGWTPELNDDVKNNWDLKFKQANEKNYVVGIKGLQIWETPDYQETYNSILNKYTNVPGSNVDSFNNPENVEFRPEEAMYCQDLYKTLDAVIQEVLANKNADPAELLKKANADFQTNFLDNAQ